MSLKIDIDEIKSMAQRNKKIALIKKYREFSGAPLKEAKDAIEDCSYSSSENEQHFNIDQLLFLFTNIKVLHLITEFKDAQLIADDVWDKLGFANPAELHSIVAFNFKQKFEGQS